MKHILVVDDEPAMLTLLSRLLSAMSYQVITASSGPAALAAVASDAIDLVVTDYRMPEMSGRDLILALRAQRPGLKALVVTGFPPHGAEDRSWWVDQPFLAKPFSRRSLHDAVVALVGPP
jgi:CheY-like chemotaxis protein